MKLNSLDRSHTAHKTTATSAVASMMANKCSVQEGVRMMVTPSMFMTAAPPQEKAILNPPVNVQRAVIVTQENFEANKSAGISTTAETKQGSSKLETTGDPSAVVKSPTIDTNKQGKSNGTVKCDVN